MNKSIRLGSRIINEDSPAFIIAELSCNHGNSLDIVFKTIDAMAEAGADCVKVQTSKPDGITLSTEKEDFRISGGTLWDGRTLHDLYSEVYLPWEWHRDIKNYVEKKGMFFFSSPFDREAVDFLEKLGVEAYKIASFEITDIPLIKHVASKQKPVIISTGIATQEDIDLALETCRLVGNHDVIVLKCTSAYPTPLSEANLRVIPWIQDEFDCLVGLSDHTIGSIVPISSIGMGAKVIEKHFILNKSIGGPDADFSMVPSDFKAMVDGVRSAEECFGTSNYIVSEKMIASRQFARSLYVSADIKMGEVFTVNNIKCVRPGYGLHPKYFERVLGKVCVQDVEKGDRLAFEMIEDYKTIL